jgi:hypothetical protein
MRDQRTYRPLQAGLLVAVIAVVAPADAPAGTIATFTLKDKQVFTFKNDGTDSFLSASLIGATFEYKVKNKYGAPNTPIDAELTLVAKVSDKASNNAGNVTQPLSLRLLGVAADKAVDGKNNLMQAGAFAPDMVITAITGTLNAKQSIYSGPTKDSPKALSIDSDFLDFNGLYEKLGVEITLKPMNNPLTINKNGYLDNFTASGSGVIFGLPVTALAPEPSTSVLALAGLLSVPALFLRNAFSRRRSSS